VYNLDV